MASGSLQPWHQKYWPIRAVREYARQAVFHLVEKLFATEDGKRIAADALKGLLYSPLKGIGESSRGNGMPYPDLGTAAEDSRETAAAPIFISARFRSGSTLLWNVFRHVAGCTSYYEPLNPRRWFDPAMRGDRIDDTHRGVSDYWREYDGLEVLGKLYREEWAYQHLLMDESFWEPRLKRYVEVLVERAQGRAVLQFNRIDFRLPWFRRHFPGATVIHLYRHPRDQWCSSLVDVRAFPKEGRVAGFPPHDHFYLLSWARDLRYHFPFLDEAGVEHPYALFYYIWKLSYLFGVKYAHCSVAYENLVANPERELTRLLETAGVENADLGRLRGLVDGAPAGKWRAYADDGWFRKHESACERVLADFLE